MFAKKYILKVQVVFLIALTAIFLAGCGSNGGTKISQDPCSLLSQEDLGSLFSGPAEGRDVSENMQTEDGTDSYPSYGCQYVLTGKVAEKSDENPFPTPENINIQYVVVPTAQDAQKAYDKVVSLWKGSTIPNRTYQEVNGVGTKAFWSYSNNVSQFIVYKDTRVFFITLGYFKGSSDDILAKAKVVGQKVIESI